MTIRQAATSPQVVSLDIGTIGINMVPIEPHTEKDTTREKLRNTEIIVIDIIGDEETDTILTTVEVGEDIIEEVIVILGVIQDFKIEMLLSVPTQTIGHQGMIQIMNLPHTTKMG